MKFLVIALCLLSGVAGLAQETTTIHDPNAVNRNLNGSFTAIHVTDGIMVYLSEGKEESVAVSFSDGKYAERFKTEVENGVLKIYYDNKGINWSDNNKRKPKAYVSFKNIDLLKASGGSDVKVTGSITASKLSMHVSGGSDFEGKVNIDELKIDASGGSDVDISGTAKNLDINASGGSDFKGYELITDNSTVDASGGSDVYITVNKELNANSSGGSDVYYKGNGLIKNIKSSGSTIKKVSR